MKVITEWWAIIKSRCNNPEQWAIDQALELSKLPFLHKHIALMPDTHQWYGMPIGWVIACEWVIIPNAVGVDIGCGMCAIKTSLTNINTETLKEILWEIRKQIPVGFKHHNDEQEWCPSLWMLNTMPIVFENHRSSLKQIWTLWGWNHFIEIQKWDDWHIWVMIHSWSRNVWLQVATHYNNLAKKLNAERYSNVPKDLNFLPIDSKEWKMYIQEMDRCLEFALSSRKHMMSKVIDIIWNITIKNKETKTFSIEDEMINIHHNYASKENHYWKNVVVHRKWATLARKWTIGIIPWSQWTKSYIVKWLWKKESFMSCSHWAGRTMWRKAAQENLDIKAEQKMLDDQWILHSIRWVGDLDEAPSAYKDIDVVMEEQKDLVEILVELTPLAVIKW